jgi:hypothetical protein
VGDKWLPRDDKMLTFTLVRRTPEEFIFEIKGRRVFFEDGRETKQEVSYTLPYQFDGKALWPGKVRPREDWVPLTMTPDWGGGDKSAAPLCFHLPPRGFPHPRGFVFADLDGED